MNMDSTLNIYEVINFIIVIFELFYPDILIYIRKNSSIIIYY